MANYTIYYYYTVNTILRKTKTDLNPISKRISASRPHRRWRRKRDVIKRKLKEDDLLRRKEKMQEILSYGIKGTKGWSQNFEKYDVEIWTMNKLGQISLKIWCSGSDIVTITIPSCVLKISYSIHKVKPKWKNDPCTMIYHNSAKIFIIPCHAWRIFQYHKSHMGNFENSNDARIILAKSMRIKVIPWMKRKYLLREKFHLIHRIY